MIYRSDHFNSSYCVVSAATALRASATYCTMPLRKTGCLVNFLMYCTRKLMTTTRTLVLLGGVCFVAYMLARKDRMVYTKSSGGTRYLVKNLPDARRAADHLDALAGRLRNFLAAAPGTDPCIARIRARWSGTLAEVEDSSKDIAYSLGKRVIFICVREPNGQLADFNTCMYVLIHELAHVATPEVGHTPAFWRAMKYLLELAQKQGAYRDVGAKSVNTLCGRVLGESPAACVKSGECASELS